MPEIDVDGFNPLGGNHGWPLLTTPNQTYQGLDNISYTRGKHTSDSAGNSATDHRQHARPVRKGVSALQAVSCLHCATVCLVAAPAQHWKILSRVCRAERKPERRRRIFIGNSSRHVSINSFGGFFQDDWRATARLTVNAGVRYD